jgi:hypothetical protein
MATHCGSIRSTSKEVQIMRLGTIAAFFCFTAIAATPALASDETEVVSRIQQVVDAGNKNLNADLTPNFMPSVVIVDDLPPYVFEGPTADAMSNWLKAYGTDSEKNGITDFSMKLLKARQVRVSGDRAYIAVPAIYMFKEHLKPSRTKGIVTATLKKVDNKWLIATWSWTGE